MIAEDQRFPWHGSGHDAGGGVITLELVVVLGMAG
jgi:hypothetical protein